jgi:hypothetical protein
MLAEGFAIIVCNFLNRLTCGQGCPLGCKCCALQDRNALKFVCVVHCLQRQLVIATYIHNVTILTGTNLLKTPLLFL